MGDPVQPINKYTYADYLTWNDNERWEIIDGVPYNISTVTADISPAPRRIHQKILIKLIRIIDTYLLGKKCELYCAPFDVRLGDNLEEEVMIENVVQPDIVVYCDEKKLDDKGGKGAPDFVVEILSPSTAEKDLGVKTLLYQRYGVKEYWIIDPEKKLVMVAVLNESKRFDPFVEYNTDAAIKSFVLQELTINLSDIF